MNEIFGVHVELMDVHPTVWRKLEIRADSSFWDLHCAIQDAMPWEDLHLHEFRFPIGDTDTQIGIPEYDYGSNPSFLASWDTHLKDWFPKIPGQCLYIYDFGDDWQHKVFLQERKSVTHTPRRPRCVDGQGMCPPEDVGGPHGFLEFKEAMSDPTHERHEELVEWFGSVWQDTGFDPGSVKFSSPKRRLQMAGLGD